MLGGDHDWREMPSVVEVCAQLRAFAFRAPLW
jgi:hypothetical protein